MKFGTRRQRSGRIAFAVAAGLWLASGEGVAEERFRAQTEPALERPLSQLVMSAGGRNSVVLFSGCDVVMMYAFSSVYVLP